MVATFVLTEPLVITPCPWQLPSPPLRRQRHGLHNRGWQLYAKQTNDSRGGTSVRQTQGLIVLNQGPCILRVAKRWKLRAPFCVEGAATVQPTNPEMRRYKWKRQVPCYRSTFLPFCLSTLLSFHLSISLHSFSRPAITQPHIEHQHEFYWFHTGFTRFMLQNSGPLFVDGNGNGTSHPPSETDMYMEASSSIILCCPLGWCEAVSACNVLQARKGMPQFRGDTFSNV